MKTIVGIFLAISLSANVSNGNEPKPTVLKSGSVTRFIDFGGALPQFDRELFSAIKGGGISRLTPVLFSACYRDGRVIECFAGILDYTTVAMPNDPDSTKTKVVLGVFYRFPYEFNAGWSLVPETINESGRSASGIIDLGDLRKDATQLAEVLRKGFDFPLWPGAIGDSDAEWLKDIIFEAGCRKIDKEDKLIDALSHRSPNDRED